jgi:DNA polymerase-3 subunit epsilon
MRQIILDTETTGLAPDAGHRIIEIGCVEVVNRRVTGRTLHHYINPEREVDEGAAAVHGMRWADLQGRPLFAAVVDEVLEFVAGAEVLIHNAPFDEGFLNAELARLHRGVFRTWCGGVVDTLKLARELHPGKRNSLDALCDRYGISNAHRTWHGALLDSQLLAEVYLAMTRGQESLAMPVEVERRGGGQRDPGVWPPVGLVSVVVHDAERAAHRETLARIAKGPQAPALWSA